MGIIFPDFLLSARKIGYNNDGLAWGGGAFSVSCNCRLGEPKLQYKP